ncbi:MAG: hypothetical protein CVU16_04550 [Betaproteobacteria bacterium HGW-Betaproteobacteria-10]|nr:MAG: hypothetical protein CVU16_04550 [Betaproteobacteria bacterium HGW-Betaproteobacteria-10]
MRRLVIYCFVLLTSLAPTAWAGNITLLLTVNSGPYAEFAASFAEALDTTRWTISFASKLENDNQATDLIVSAGGEALRQALENSRTTPIIATLLPRHSYEKIVAQSSNRQARVTAIYLDQPPARQAAFLRHLLPEKTRIGMLFSEKTRSQASAYKEALKNAGLTLESAESETPASLLPKLNILLTRVDVLLAIPDGTIYNRDNIKPILVTSYRHQRPVVAFSAPFVSAGALAALHSTPAQIGRQSAELVNKMGSQLPPPMPPSQFAISINANVAEALGLAVPDEAELRRAMLTEREPR